MSDECLYNLPASIDACTCAAELDPAARSASPSGSCCSSRFSASSAAMCSRAS